MKMFGIILLLVPFFFVLASAETFQTPYGNISYDDNTETCSNDCEFTLTLTSNQTVALPIDLTFNNTKHESSKLEIRRKGDAFATEVFSSDKYYEPYLVEYEDEICDKVTKLGTDERCDESHIETKYRTEYYTKYTKIKSGYSFVSGEEYFITGKGSKSLLTSTKWTLTIGSWILDPVWGSDWESNSTLEIINGLDSSLNTTANITWSKFNDSMKYIYDWTVNGTSIMTYNLPFEKLDGTTTNNDLNYINGVSGTEQSTPVWNATGGYDGKGAYLFDGSLAYISYAEAYNFTNVSFTGWFKAETVANDAVVDRGDGGTDTSWMIIQTAAGDWVFQNHLANGSIHRSRVGCDSDKKYVFVSAWFSSTQYIGEIYCNGLADSTTNLSTAFSQPGTGTLIKVGERTTGAGLNYHGYIDELMIFNRTISPEQMRAIYNNKTNLIVSQEKEAGEVWDYCVTPNDQDDDGVEKCFNNLPTHNIPVLNSTEGATASTNANLTAYAINVSDVDGDSVKSIYNWKVNNNDLLLLNVPFEGVSSTTVNNAYDYSKNQNVPELVSSVTWSKTAGYDGKGAYVYGTTFGYMNYSNTSANIDNVSISFKFEADSNSSFGDYYILVFGETDDRIMFGLDGLTDELSFIDDINDANSETIIQNFNTNQYYDVNLVFNSNGTKIIYIDGIATNHLNGGGSSLSEVSVPNLYLGGSETTRDFDGTFDEVRIWNRSLTSEQVLALYNNKTDLIVSQETEDNDVWNVCVTPNDNKENGITKCSNNLTVGTAPVITLTAKYALNSSADRRDDFNSTGLEDIEKVVLNFTITATNTIDQWQLNFTMNGTNACSFGNEQDTHCYNITNTVFKWINYLKGNKTNTFDDSIGGTATGDSIVTIEKGTRNNLQISITIDEHYQNVFKWYDALFNFSDVKYQTGTDQKITQDNEIRIEVNETEVPVNSDDYKLDLRVQATGNPTQPLLAYACNTSYSTGDVEFSNNCNLVASKLPSELQDDGTKFRAIFTNNLISDLVNIKYIVLKTDSNNPNKYYAIKTYKALSAVHSTRWRYSTDVGEIWSNFGDGYESELNINWYSNGVLSPTSFIYKLWVNDTAGKVTTYQNNITWHINASFNYAPIVEIDTPTEGSAVTDLVSINWTTADTNNDNYRTNVTISNSSNTYRILNNSDKIIVNTSFNFTTLSEGNYNITVQSCENETADLLCGESTHQVSITFFPFVYSIFDTGMEWIKLIFTS